MSYYAADRKQDGDDAYLAIGQDPDDGQRCVSLWTSAGERIWAIWLDDSAVSNFVAALSATEPGCVDCGQPMRGDVLKECQNPECGMYAEPCALDEMVEDYTAEDPTFPDQMKQHESKGENLE